jgi:hypothetical protein
MPSAFGDLNRLLMWCTRGENCAICNSLRGRVYSYDMWASSGVWPGFHFRCDCYLKPVDSDTKTSDPDFFGTDLYLLSETLNPKWGGPLMLHWDANFQPFSWYMTQQIKEAHITYGATRSIGDVLRNMTSEFLGFFKRSKIWDNFFIWRTFRTVQHFQQIDGGYQGEALLPYLFKPWAYPKTTKKTFRVFPALNVVNATLKPDSLKPYYPYQSNYTEEY